MAITQSLCASFKTELLAAVHNFTPSTGDTFKIALYATTAELNSSTLIYTTVGEVVGSGYVAGGNTLTGQSISLSGTTAFVTFTNSLWVSSTLTATGALIYNSTNANKAVAVLDFGGPFSSTNNTFTVTFPPSTATTAVIRIS
jgi:hypothetical protein